MMPRLTCSGARCVFTAGGVVRAASRRDTLLLAMAFFLGALLLLDQPPVVCAEVQQYDIFLEATDAFVHYGDGYLRGPGASIDLRDLTFEAIGEAAGGPPANNFQSAGGDDDGERAMLVVRDRRWLKKQGGVHAEREDKKDDDGGMDVGKVNETAHHVDVVSFMLPGHCASSRSGCDWTELGVGARHGDDLRWCCTHDAIAIGMCNEKEDYGRLIVTSDFQGMRRSIKVPHTGPMKKKLNKDYFQFNESGRYVVVLANCDDAGRNITVSGKAIWKSSHGYLPGQLYDFLYFYFALLGVYVLLFVWFVCLMQRNAASRIPIEKWILLTIVMGLCEILLRTLDYISWNQDGNRPLGLTYSSILMGVFKDGFSRCLIVMVALGWGVIRDSLHSDLPKIVVLGVVYMTFATILEFTIEFARQDLQSLSYDQEIKLLDFATIIDFVVAAVNVVFIMWSLDALNATMTYLENMNQTRKLQRYLRLRTLFLFAVLFAVIWTVFALVDEYDEDGIVREEHEWIVIAAMEVNHLAVLIGVAILWRPNPNAKEYAYVMELPAMGGDGENELELTDAVPSALDDDDEGPHIQYSNGHHDERFKIDEAELS